MPRPLPAVVRPRPNAIRPSPPGRLALPGPLTSPKQSAPRLGPVLPPRTLLRHGRTWSRLQLPWRPAPVRGADRIRDTRPAGEGLPLSEGGQSLKLVSSSFLRPPPESRASWTQRSIQRGPVKPLQTPQTVCASSPRSGPWLLARTWTLRRHTLPLRRSDRKPPSPALRKLPVSPASPRARQNSGRLPLPSLRALPPPTSRAAP
mmetsp:Transcript_11357/g.27255  ORF Transcript_11357/g.27255 Transcript_11357/m.27255 type:complete len:204 (-) Transcript_11357:1009-1620(-)